MKSFNHLLHHTSLYELLITAGDPSVLTKVFLFGPRLGSDFRIYLTDTGLPPSPARCGSQIISYSLRQHHFTSLYYRKKPAIRQGFLLLNLLKTYIAMITTITTALISRAMNIFLYSGSVSVSCSSGSASVSDSGVSVSSGS